MRPLGIASRVLASAVLPALVGLGTTTPLAAQDTATADVEAARGALRTGRYDQAIESMKDAVGRDRAYPAADRMLVEALIEVGRYAEAEDRASKSVRRHAGSAEMQRSLGDALVRQGKLDEAGVAYRAAEAGGASDAALARLGEAELLYRAGARQASLEIFDGFIDFYNEAPSLSAAELSAVGTALTYLGLGEPDLFQDAVRAFEEAIDANPSDPEPRVRLGDLFLAKYDSRNARDLFQDALQQNPAHAEALLGLARSAYFDGTSEALDLARESVETNPNLVGAHVFLSRLYLDLGDWSRARDEAEAALDVNPVSLEALSMLAAVEFVSGDRRAFERVGDRALALNPAYADLFNTVAEIAVRRRLYAEAVQLSERAVALDARSWRGYGNLGVNELRIGRIESGAANLKAAFDGDPFNVWYSNTLNLLNLMERTYEAETSPRFEFVASHAEVALMAVYMADVAEQAYDRLADRYDFRPETPIRVEVFARHADFSVRTVGLTGFGALGVSFGNVLAVNSPSAHEPGHFNWGSTLWHEISHAFTLGATNHMIPRWFTEGLAVYDERLARPGWGNDVTPGFLVAWLDGELLPIADLNRGFVRPSYPGQIGHVYYHSSLVCEMIEETYDHQAILDMLAGFRDGLTTREVLRDVLGVTADAFDEAFFAWFEARFAGPIAALSAPATAAQGPPDPRERHQRTRGEFGEEMVRAAELVRAGRTDEAIGHLERARNLFPEYAGEDAPGVVLADLYEQRGDPDAAIRALVAVTDINESFLHAYMELARLYGETGDARREADILLRSQYIWPLEAETHDRLAELASEVGDIELEIRERRALVALRPVDMAEAHFRLALAYEKAGEHRSARRAVLAALEVAPNFGDAQDLLLRLRERSGGGGT